MGLTTITEARSRIAVGRIPGASRVQLRGRNDAISTNAEVLWFTGGEYPSRLTSNTAMEVVSTQAGDAAAGTGARTVFVSGVKADGTIATETVSMNGATAVICANTYTAINSLQVLTTGSAGANAGDISIRTSVGGQVWRTIQGSTRSAGLDTDFFYQVPANHALLIYDLSWSADNTTDATVCILRKYLTNIGPQQSIYTQYSYTQNQPVNYVQFAVPLVIEAGYAVACLGQTAAGVGEMHAQASCILVNLSSATTYAKWI